MKSENIYLRNLNPYIPNNINKMYSGMYTGDYISWYNFMRPILNAMYNNITQKIENKEEGNK